MCISVIIPTYNPNINRLKQTLAGLSHQTLDFQYWELILIDNNSTNSFKEKIDTSWHQNFQIFKEKKQGLTYARLKGFEKARGELIVMVDDDNILAADYLEKAIDFMTDNKQVGAVGGKSIGLYEGFEPEPWTKEFLSMIAVRDLGEDIMISNNKIAEYPSCAPIGAGMVIRKHLLISYIEYITSGKNQITDRIGNSLASGGDNEINIFVLKQNFAVAYQPQLILEHIIPENRLSKAYLSRLNFESSCSWVKLLHSQNLNVWAPIAKSSLVLRYIKSYVMLKAWYTKANFVKWKGSCGIFKGLSEI